MGYGAVTTSVSAPCTVHSTACAEFGSMSNPEVCSVSTHLRVLALAVLCCAFVAARPAIAAHPKVRQYYVPVLIYHHIKWSKPSDDATERGLTIYPSQFAAHLKYLRANHYHAISALTLTEALRGSARLPSKPVVLSFDDGYTDVYDNVYKVLRTDHMTATFFIIAGLVGQPRYLTWTQIQDMAKHGMDIEAHTMTHPDLTVVPAAQTWGEIDQSRLVLQQHLHRSVRVFCYPYGAYDTLVLKDVAKAGYWAAFTTQEGYVESSAHMLTLPRVYANHDDTVPVTASMIRPGA
jgi:peptidoglycan/xylan/chitin deacetylase (PgdA/CDA1 family)